MRLRPCWVEISAPALEENYRVLARRCLEASGIYSLPDSKKSDPVELLAIVKANAYGHGLSICAPAAVRAGAHWLGVTSVEEGVATRALCPHAEILVISGPFTGQGAAVVANRLTAVVWDAWQLYELEGAAEAAGVGELPVHLELDTGMTRQGVGAEGLDKILECLRACRLLRVDGLMTHLYAADESDGAETRGQMAELEALVTRVVAAGLRPNWLHVGNSAAVLGGEAVSALAGLAVQWGMRAMARPGLALYGLAPEFLPPAAELTTASVAALRARLTPVLTWKTQVVSVRAVEPGAVLGYNGTFVATEPMRVALLAVGYGDGLRRGLSNRGTVLIRGERAPIVGRISMDQTVVDVTEIAGADVGDEAVLLGRQGEDRISPEEHAAWAGTIVWEILTSIAERVERVAL